MMLLTNSKVPIVNGLEMIRNMVSFFSFKNNLKNIKDEKSKGEKMIVSLKKHKIFEKKIIDDLKVVE